MGMFDGYMICSDLDGTLAIDGSVPENNSKAIKYFQDNGGMFVLATGRSINYLEKLKNSFVCDKYIIACNGNILYNIQTKEIEKYYLLDLKSEDIVKDVIDSFEGRLQAVSYVGMEDRTLYEKKPEINYEGAYAAFDYKITKVVFTTETPADAIEIKKYLEDRYKDEYSIKRTWDTGLEIWNKDAGKAQMIRYLREKLDNVHTVICAGDYENDIAMLEESDLSYAPANAFEGAKEAADIVGVSCAEGLINQIVSDLKEKLS